MRLARILNGALVIAVPCLFVVVAQWLWPVGLTDTNYVASAVCLLGLPLLFAVLLAHMFLRPGEEGSVRCVRASFRLGNMALGTMGCAFGLAGVLFAVREPRDFLLLLTLFLLMSAVWLALFAMVSRILQGRADESGGVFQACLALTPIAIGVLFVATLPPVKHESCANNLKQLGLVCKMFADEGDGMLPELSAVPGFLSMRNNSPAYKNPIMPEFCAVADGFFCPHAKKPKLNDNWLTSNPQEVLDQSSYLYFGYALASESELETFHQCYRERIAAGLPFNEDLPAPSGEGSGGGDKFLRLREGVERIYITDVYRPDGSAFAQSNIPILIEHPGNHEKQGGVNVLYMDGHIEYCRRGEWPATPRTFEIVAAIEALRTKTGN